MIRVCKYCYEEIYDEKGKIFANHVRWCKKNIKYNHDKYIEKRHETEKNKLKEKIENYNKNPKKCIKCNSILLYKYKKRKFCDNCQFYAHKSSTLNDNFNETKETICIECKKKIFINKRASTKNARCFVCKNLKNKKIISSGKYCKIYFYECKKCKNIYSSSKNRKNLLCKECEHFSMKEYRSLCQFNFSLNQYSNEFDFDLIKKYGWYSAKNRGNNLTGVSRDHIISIKYGYENKIPSEIISHPANCQLLRHNDNIRKNTKNIITYNELLEKIYYWNLKYNKNN